MQGSQELCSRLHLSPGFELPPGAMASASHQSSLGKIRQGSDLKAECNLSWDFTRNLIGKIKKSQRIRTEGEDNGRKHLSPCQQVEMGSDVQMTTHTEKGGILDYKCGLYTHLYQLTSVQTGSL